MITPTLGFTYEVTARVAGVIRPYRRKLRGRDYPLDRARSWAHVPYRRQTGLAAQKMQQLQPLLKELQEKYKDDKERQTKNSSRSTRNTESIRSPAAFQP